MFIFTRKPKDPEINHERAFLEALSNEKLVLYALMRQFQSGSAVDEAELIRQLEKRIYEP